MAPFSGLEEKIQSLSSVLLKHSTVQTFLISLTALTFCLWQMSLVLNQIQDITNLPILDSRLSYSPREAHILMRALGRQGRELYLQFNLIDFGFPFVFAAICIALIGPVYRRAGLWAQVNVFPLIYLAFDLCENIAIRYLLTNFPGWSPKVAYAASELTRYKFRFTLYTALIIVFGLLAVTWAMIQARFARRQGMRSR